MKIRILVLALKKNFEENFGTLPENRFSISKREYSTMTSGILLKTMVENRELG